MKYAKYIKVFVLVGAVFTLVMFPFLALILGARTGFGASTVVGVIFGAIGAGIIYWADEKHREEGHEVQDFEIRAQRAEDTVEVKKSVPEAMDLCKSALRLFPSAKIVRQGDHFLVARTGPGSGSLGEILEFAAAEEGGLTRIGVGSKPAFSWLPIGGAKNANNVAKLVREIGRRAEGAK